MRNKQKEDPMDTPNPGLIYDLYTGVFRPQVIRLALQHADMAQPPCGFSERMPRS